jgi:hypothetical protein
MIGLRTLLVKFLPPPILGCFEFHIGVHGCYCCIRFWYVKLLQNQSDKSLLATTDAVVIVVDLNAMEFWCWTEVCDLLFLY